MFKLKFWKNAELFFCKEFNISMLTVLKLKLYIVVSHWTRMSLVGMGLAEYRHSQRIWPIGDHQNVVIDCDHYHMVEYSIEKHHLESVVNKFKLKDLYPKVSSMVSFQIISLNEGTKVDNAAANVRLPVLFRTVLCQHPCYNVFCSPSG